VGVITFSTTARVNFDLNDHTYKSSVLSAINGISYVQGSTHTDLGLNLAWTKIFGQQGDRPDAQNILFVLTDGQSSSPAATSAQATLARNHNIKTYAIGIGNNVRRNELNSIAMTSNYVIQVSDFSSLQSIAAKLKNDLCSGRP
jgi:secreted protein with Ig-like and vWFA domain